MRTARENLLTVLKIGLDIGASGIVAPPVGGTRRRAVTGRRSIAFFAREVVGTIGLVGGDRMGRVVAFLVVLLGIELDERTKLGAVRASM